MKRDEGDKASTMGVGRVNGDELEPAGGEDQWRRLIGDGEEGGSHGGFQQGFRRGASGGLGDRFPSVDLTGGGREREAPR